MAETNQTEEISEQVEQNSLEQNDQMEGMQEVDENEVRKFQSMYDRASAENQKLSSKVEKLEKYEPLVNLLQQRPDLVGVLQENISGTPKQEALKEDEFNPWDAFYKPESPSYNHRITEESKLVNRAVNRSMAQLQEQMFMQNLEKDLSGKYNMTPEQVSKFTKFYSQPKEDLSLDTLVDVFKKQENNAPTIDSSMDAVRANKEAPRSAGVIQGQQPQKKSEADSMWERVTKAGSRSNVL